MRFEVNPHPAPFLRQSMEYAHSTLASPWSLTSWMSVLTARAKAATRAAPFACLSLALAVATSTAAVTAPTRRSCLKSGSSCSGSESTIWLDLGDGGGPPSLAKPTSAFTAALPLGKSATHRCHGVEFTAMPTYCRTSSPANHVGPSPSPPSAHTLPQSAKADTESSSRRSFSSCSELRSSVYDASCFMIGADTSAEIFLSVSDSLSSPSSSPFFSDCPSS
mmetsp:Transcript_6458/g.16851  ORF Transcript_6458/g.16851 Transcript_6458/m.16851 type:complete len:221 (+) Transcript_6458:798-1460(+)